MRRCVGGFTFESFEFEKVLSLDGRHEQTTMVAKPVILLCNTSPGV